MAARFDPGTGQLEGESFPVAESVRLGQGVSGRAAFSVSDAGTVVYRRGGALLSQLTLLDRGGRLSGGSASPQSTISSPYRRMARVWWWRSAPEKITTSGS